MVVFTNPLWLIKTRLQLQIENSHATNATNHRHYNGFIDAFKTIVREEGGIPALYRGVIPALFLTTHGAVQFVAYERMKELIEEMGWAKPIKQQVSTTNPADGQKDTGRVAIPMQITATLGVVSKLVASTGTYPYQVIKTKLQQRDAMFKVTANTGELISSTSNTTSSHNALQAIYKGPWDCVVQILK